jgi:hypothetical protein
LEWRYYPFMKSKHRRIVVDGVAYRWNARWQYDIDGRRVVTLTVAFETEPPSEGRAKPRSTGPILRVNLAANSPGYIDTSYTTPRDVRAVILFARQRGWAPAPRGGTFQIMPDHGLELDALAVVRPRLVRDWAGKSPIYTACFASSALGPKLAEALAVPWVEGAHAPSEPHWQSGVYDIESTGPDARSSSRGSTLRAKDFDDLVSALRAARSLARDVGVSLRVQASTHEVELLDTADIPRVVIPAARWAAEPGAERFPGWRDKDESWLLGAGDARRLESYYFYPDGSALWTWLSVTRAASVERRFVQRA